MKPRPMIAVVLDDLGLNRPGTRRAIVPVSAIVRQRRGLARHYVETSG